MFQQQDNDPSDLFMVNVETAMEWAKILTIDIKTALQQSTNVAHLRCLNIL